MEVVYTLRSELDGDPEQVRLAQALTLDCNRPQMGLAGNQGLFGSEEWWKNVAAGRIPTLTKRGVIERVYTAGMEKGLQPNTIVFRTDAGDLLSEGLYANSEDDRQAYQVGRAVEYRLALDELKTGGRSDIVLEVRIGTTSSVHQRCL